jgi:hypothetical protein
MVIESGEDLAGAVALESSYEGRRKQQHSANGWAKQVTAPQQMLSGFTAVLDGTG